MSEDSMEIVTETNSHDDIGINGDGDEYFEIDMDIPHGISVDEDDMIEDAPHSMEGEDIADKNDALAEVDQYMFDDENEGVTYETTDELMYEEDNIEHEVSAHSYVNVEDPEFPSLVEDAVVRSPPTEIEVQKSHTEAKSPASVRFGETLSGQALPTEGDAESRDEVPNAFGTNFEIGTDERLQTGVEDATQDDVSQYDVDADGEQYQESNSHEAVAADDADSGTVNEEEPSEQKLTTLTELGLRRTLVMYQSGEYHLFNNGSDDPEQYFIDDLAIATEHISVLFSHLRDVLNGEIRDDEELCISFRDFGLELEETSCSELELNIAQMLHLHDRLIENENLEDPDLAFSERPLRIYLATRPVFAARLMNLLQGATARKTLSEILNGDESEDYSEADNAQEEESERDELELEETQPDQTADAEQSDSDNVDAEELVAKDHGSHNVEDRADRLQSSEPLAEYGDDGREAHNISSEIPENNDVDPGFELDGKNEDYEEHAAEVNVARPTLDATDSPQADGVTFDDEEYTTIEDGDRTQGDASTKSQLASTHGNLHETSHADETITYGSPDLTSKSKDEVAVIDELEDWDEEFQDIAHPSAADNANNDNENAEPGREFSPNHGQEAQHENHLDDHEVLSEEIPTLGQINGVELSNHFPQSPVAETVAAESIKSKPNTTEVDDDEIDFSLDDDHDNDSAKEVGFQALEADETTIAWSNAPDLETVRSQLDAERHEDLASSGTLSAVDEAQAHQQTSNNNSQAATAVDPNLSGLDSSLEDEITYDDDDCEPDLRTPLKTEFASNAIKRTWQDLEGGVEDSTTISPNGDAKRVRS